MERGYRLNPVWLCLLQCGIVLLSPVLKPSNGKIQDDVDLRPPSWILVQFYKSKILALDGVKTLTNFQNDRSNGLKVIAITKIQWQWLQNPRWRHQTGSRNPL
jgi:hypothetical protein